MAANDAKGLTHALVIESAADLVDRDGWQQLTMTELAAKLGVRVPSLYSHVDNVEALLGEVQVYGHSLLADRLQRAAMGKAGEPALRALASVVWDFSSDHGGLYELAMARPIHPDAVLEASEPGGAALRAVIESFGIDAPPLDLLLACLAPLHGVISLDRAGFLAHLVDATEAYDRAVGMVISLLDGPAGR